MSDSGNGEICITKEQLDDAPKDWATTHLESKGKPVWTRTVDIDGHLIELTNYNADFEFTETHDQELRDFVRQARQFNPELIANFKRLIFDDFQPPSRYVDEEKFPGSGTILGDGVLLYKRGVRTDIRHRTGKVSNFQGTIAHECFHHIQGNYLDSWKEDFDWHYVGENMEDWEPLPGYRAKTFRNKKNGRIAYGERYTNRPELCVTDYASRAWDDDLADSGVVALFEPTRLELICPQKLVFLQNTRLPIR